jgi:hypothetical protein
MSRSLGPLISSVQAALNALADKGWPRDDAELFLEGLIMVETSAAPEWPQMREQIVAAGKLPLSERPGGPA